MLVFKRPKGGKVVVACNGQTLELTVGRIGQNYVELLFDAPMSFQIDRGEVAELRVHGEPTEEEIAELEERKNGKKSTF